MFSKQIIDIIETEKCLKLKTLIIGKLTYHTIIVCNHKFRVFPNGTIIDWQTDVCVGNSSKIKSLFSDSELVDEQDKLSKILESMKLKKE